MAAEVRFRHVTTAETLYFTVRQDSDSKYWNGSTTEALTIGNWPNYDISLVETPSGAYFYMGNFPAVSVGWCHVDVFKQVTATATISDPIQASLFGYWDGTYYKMQGSDVVQGNGYVLVAKGTVTNASFTPTTTEFESSELNAAATNHYQGRAIVFTSGTLKDQATSINSYAKSGSNGHFYVAALTSAPSNTDSFVIV